MIIMTFGHINVRATSFSFASVIDISWSFALKARVSLPATPSLDIIRTVTKLIKLPTNMGEMSTFLNLLPFPQLQAQGQRPKAQPWLLILRKE